MLNRKDLSIFALIAILFTSVTTISLAPMNVNALTEDTPTLDKSSSFIKNGDDEETRDTKSNEQSSNSKAEVNIDGKHNIDDDDDSPANVWDRTIHTPNKDIDVSGSSNEKSSNADSSFECFACFGGVEIEDEG